MTSHRGLLHHLILTVSDVPRSSLFYGPVLGFLGYEKAGSSATYEDWKRWDLETPHELSIVQAAPGMEVHPHRRGAVGHHHHLAFCARDRADVDALHTEVLLPLQSQGLCRIEDAPCDCPEYDEGYYATFFSDPDGLKFEFVINPNHGRRLLARQASSSASAC